MWNSGLILYWQSTHATNIADRLFILHVAALWLLYQTIPADFFTFYTEGLGQLAIKIISQPSHKNFSFAKIAQMKKVALFILFTPTWVWGQDLKGRQPHIEMAACPFVTQGDYRIECSYLSVPENRRKQNSKIIRMPFARIFSKDSAKRKDPVIYTAGGPGGSSLRWVLNLPGRSILQNRDYIAFEQRGTQYAIPNLWSPELALAIRQAIDKTCQKTAWWR